MEKKCNYITLGALLSIILLIALFLRNRSGSSLISTSNFNTYKDSITDLSRGLTETFSEDELKYFEYGIGNEDEMNSKLYRYIRQKIISPTTLRPISQWHGIDFSQFGQSKVVDNILEKRRNGFFVECGARNGFDGSNTAFFERERNWTGLLVEVDPTMTESLLKCGRRAYMLTRCLSPTKKPLRTKFHLSGVLSGLTNFSGGNSPGKRKRPREIMVTCFPFNSVMQALGIRHIDFFSLDVEGAELDILQTIDFERIRIDIIMVEYGITPVQKRVAQSNEKLKAIQTFLNSTKLYDFVSVIKESRYNIGLDAIFKRIH